MSISGTGVQNDPYIVTTYAELVEKAATANTFVKLGNDINILNEYTANVPKLEVSANIDGDGHTILNLFNTNSSDNYMIRINPGGLIENVSFLNLNITANSFIFSRTSAQYGVSVKDCNFAGIVNCSYFTSRNGDNHMGAFDGCSVNIKGENLVFSSDYTTNTHSNNYIKIKTNAANIFNISANNRIITLANCYLDITAPNITGLINKDTLKLQNCAVDLKTNAAPSIAGNDTSVSIINRDHAPNVTVSSNLAAVPDNKWLDLEHLDSIGFNVVTEG